MSQSLPVYAVKKGAPASLAVFKGRRCARPYSDPSYSLPSPVEVDALIKLMGWSQSDVAKLLGVTYNPKKGSSTVRKWRADPSSKDYRQIPYSAWRLLLLYAGVVSLDDGLAAIDKV